jgi:hypothetical protein
VARWRTVHLTEKPDPVLPEAMKGILDSWKPVGFPEFIPIYIERDLNIKLQPR